MSRSINDATLTVSRVVSYGRELFYPVCNRAKALAQIADCRTLTLAQLKLVKGLGIQVLVIGDGGAERAESEINQQEKT